MKAKDIVKKANRLFSEGRFYEAKALYIDAEKLMGANLFQTNIWLCNLRQKNGVDLGLNHAQQLESQLSQTQALLEKYFNETQHLRKKVMDKKQ